MTFLGFCGTIIADPEGIPPQPKKSRIYWENPFQLRHFLAHRSGIEQITIKGDGGGEKGRSCRGAIRRLFLPKRQKKSEAPHGVSLFLSEALSEQFTFFGNCENGKKALVFGA